MHFLLVLRGVQTVICKSRITTSLVSVAIGIISIISFVELGGCLFEWNSSRFYEHETLRAGASSSSTVIG